MRDKAIEVDGCDASGGAPTGDTDQNPASSQYTILPVFVHRATAEMPLPGTLAISRGAGSSSERT